MFRILTLAILSITASFLIVSCGPKEQVKPQPKNEVKTETSAQPAATNTVKKETPKPAYDRMNDTAFANVMSVLRESLDDEKTASDSSTKLKTAKAYILVIKFIHTDKEKVVKSGMSDADINALIDNARDNAQSRLKEIVTSPTAPKALKDEAQSKLNELQNL